MKKHLTMCQLESLGFEVIKSIRSEYQVKQIRSNGLLEVVTVWEMPSGAFVEQIIREL